MCVCMCVCICVCVCVCVWGRIMARKALCCGFSSLEVLLMVLFLLMTGVTVGLVTVIAVNMNSPTQVEEVIPTVKPPEKPYLIGVGRADCTGPVADIPLMGYANPKQTAAGIHTRLFSRAFIVDDGSQRVVFVSAEIGMMSQRLRLEVLKELQLKYGDLYRQDNVVLSGTHTHSGLAGFFQYTLFMITSKGYIKPATQAIVSGIVNSIDIAHKSMKPGRIFMNKGEIVGSNLNRSPHSYMNNPEQERNRYKTNTDEQIVSLKFTDLSGNGIGMFSWFAVHAVSMNYTNRMVSSDNLGYASYLFEQEKNPNSLPGEGPFVAAFCTSNSGDASPNTHGPYCVNTGEKCDYLNSSCPIGGTKMCVAFGPGKDMFESTKIIGQNIYRKAKELYGTAEQEVHGRVHTAHQWVNMTDVSVHFNSTHSVKTCKPALGHSFAAGTIDGGGDLNFTQGAVEGDPFWDGIRDILLNAPSKDIQDCHEPKPILFSTGEMNWPLPWHPDVVDVQIITIGSVAVVAVPGEVTTMSGRRIRDAVKQELEVQNTFTNTEVVIAGLCNVYTHYIATYEEYQIQRYEGASTIYGPHTLSAYIQHFRGLAKAIVQGKVGELPKGPEPPFFKDSQLFSLLPGVPVDKRPANTTFGQVLEQVHPRYKVGEVASVTFVAGNPRNSGDMRNKTFVTVERFQNNTGTWVVVHTDASWETRFHWIKGSGGRSNATVEWHIPLSAPSGTYRIRHFGHTKHFNVTRPVITAYDGTSDVFRVTKTLYSF
ncbi:neutral ceramidase-like isoform X2 [Brachyhypopomus gauderio]|uniref:neutral ceramidase-like isoform X2 n=1 Tax=Brachyhypopomus gauderio TaxID=698409 RepID=UPI004043358E